MLQQHMAKGTKATKAEIRTYRTNEVYGLLSLSEGHSRYSNHANSCFEKNTVSSDTFC